jgi:hypothetical protein
MVRLVFRIAVIDFILGLTAFVLQFWVFQYPDIKYHLVTDLTWAIRVINFTFGLYLVLKKQGRDYILFKVNKVLSWMFLMVSAFALLDLVKNILAYRDIEIWSEMFFVKRILHFGLLTYFYGRLK